MLAMKQADFRIPPCEAAGVCLLDFDRQQFLVKCKLIHRRTTWRRGDKRSCRARGSRPHQRNAAIKKSSPVPLSASSTDRRVAFQQVPGKEHHAHARTHPRATHQTDSLRPPKIFWTSAACDITLRPRSHVHPSLIPVALVARRGLHAHAFVRPRRAATLAVNDWMINQDRFLVYVYNPANAVICYGQKN